MKDSLALLSTYDSPIDAALIRHKLQRHGIQSFAFNENFSILIPHYFGMLGSGVQVKVRNEDLEEATQIADPADQLECPNCHSSDVHLKVEKTKNKLVAIFLVFALALPIGHFLNKYYCEACGTEFSGRY